MGAGSSKLTPFSKISTGKELMVKTEEVRKMSEALFKFMYSQSNEREMWDIAKYPGDYVAALTEMIQTQFTVLGYRTLDGRPGEIYIQRYQALKPSGEKDLESIDSIEGLSYQERERMKQERKKGIEKQRQNAAIIAFYFIRLFQILGALLLVVKDISFPVVDPKTKLVRDSTAPKDLTFERAYTQKLRQYGGVSDIPKDIILGPYEFLRFYLRKVNEGMIAVYKTKYNIVIEPTWYKISDTLFFEYKQPNPKPEYIVKDIKPQSKFITYVKQGTSSSATKIELEVKITEINFTGEHKYQAPSSYDETQQFNSYPTTVKFQIVLPGTSQIRTKLDTYVVSRDDSVQEKVKGLESGIKYKFTSGGEGLANASNITPTQQFINILTKATYAQYEKAVKVTGAIVKPFGIKTDENAKTVSAKSIGKLPSEMTSATVNEMYQVLRNKEKTQPSGESIDYEAVLQPHCISRALQLLDGTSIESYLPSDGKTKVCKFSIGNSKADTTLQEYKPIKSLAQLFGKITPASYERSVKVLSAFVGIPSSSGLTPPTTTPMSVADLNGVGQVTEAEAMTKALMRLSVAFRMDTSGTPGTFAEIPIKKPKGCKTDTELPINSQPLTLELQGYARQLMAYHVKQTVNISKFLETIFDIRHESTGPVVYGPRVGFLTAGYDHLNRITDQARELLVDYYEGCEKIYQKGITSWERENTEDLPQVVPDVVPVQVPVQVPSEGVTKDPVPDRVAAVLAARERQAI